MDAAPRSLVEIVESSETTVCPLPDPVTSTEMIFARIEDWKAYQSIYRRALADEAKAVTVSGHVDGPEAGRAAADGMRKRLKDVRCELTGKNALTAPIKGAIKNVLDEIASAERELVLITAGEEGRLSSEIDTYDSKRLADRKSAADAAGVLPDLRILREGADSFWEKHLAVLVEAKRVADERKALQTQRWDLARELEATGDVDDPATLPDIPADAWETTVHLWRSRKAQRDADALADRQERERLEAEQQRLAAEREENERVAAEEKRKRDEELTQARRTIGRVRAQMLDAISTDWRNQYTEAELGIYTEEQTENVASALRRSVADARIEMVREYRSETLEDAFRGWLRGKGRKIEIESDIGLASDETFAEYLKTATRDREIFYRTRNAREDELNSIWPSWEADLDEITDEEYATLLQWCKDQRKADDDARAKAESERPARIRCAEWCDAIAIHIRDQRLPEDVPDEISAQLIRVREDILHLLSTAAAEIKENA